jgi:hypothetical protein
MTFWQKKSKKFAKLVKFTPEENFQTFFEKNEKKIGRKIHLYPPLHCPLETHYDLVVVGTSVGWLLEMKPNNE